jgi:hypothetical protein
MRGARIDEEETIQAAAYQRAGALSLSLSVSLALVPAVFAAGLYTAGRAAVEPPAGSSFFCCVGAPAAAAEGWEKILAILTATRAR